MTSWGSNAAPPSPGTMSQTITQWGQEHTLDNIRMDEYHTKGITPKWNGYRKKFFTFQQQIILWRNEAIYGHPLCF